VPLSRCLNVNVKGLLLHLVLTHPDEAIEYWPKIKPKHFGSKDYRSLYSAISKFYDTYNKLPSFSSLDLVTRDSSLKEDIQALKNLSVDPDISLDLVFETFSNEYIQDFALDKMLDLAHKITSMEAEEIITGMNDAALVLSEEIDSNEHIVTMADFEVIDTTEIEARTTLGLNNSFDASIKGIPSTELFMIGGKRGEGKSVLCSNITANQFMMGNSSIYFSIEMRAREVFHRMLSNLSGVEYSKIRNNTCSEPELLELAKTKASMFEEGEEIFQEYLEHGNFTTFERELGRRKYLKRDNQIILVDNEQLSLSDIDVNINNFKTKLGDKLKVVVVDYVNQIQINDIYDWKQQIFLSKKLKSFAKKYDIVIVAPYQIDKTGEARFAKGILDAADIAAIIDKGDDYIGLTSTKTRSTPAFSFKSQVDWPTLKILPHDYIESAEPTPETGDDLWTVQ